MHGQFFTTTNPFNLSIFYQWMDLFYNEEIVFLEPFAGACNICKMLHDLGYGNDWECYDIDPPEVEGFDIIQQDTINNFPQGFNVAITNPPYLGKSSASRRRIPFDGKGYDDLYKASLDVMLKNLDYVAAIIPESFATADLFHDRLYALISLTCKMFDDTECPVCLALFVKKEDKTKEELNENDFFIYRQSQFINKYEQIKNVLEISTYDKIKWKMNDKEGSIGIKCADNNKESSIKFIPGNEISPETIKVSSRSITRVSGLPENIDLNDFLERCNQKLNDYRDKTFDVFLTSYKGLRQDNLYRRRLDFKTAQNIMNLVMEDIENE